MIFSTMGGFLNPSDKLRDLRALLCKVPPAAAYGLRQNECEGSGFLRKQE